MRSSGRGFLSPLVRRLLTQHGLRPEDVPGTGTAGRITRNDVLAAAARRAGAGTPAGAIQLPPLHWASMQARPEVRIPDEVAPPEEPATPWGETPGRTVEPPTNGEAAAEAAASSPVATLPSPDEELVPFTPIRRRVAEHVVRSKATSAHTFCSVEVDFQPIERVRCTHNAEWREREGFSLTYLPFVARAVVSALGEFPELNASVVSGGLLKRRAVNLGFAVDIDHQGLIVPVVRNADNKRLRAIARAIVDLAARARGGRLEPDDVSGGSFTITNPGPFGTLLSIPIINQPQVAILATDGVRRRPVLVRTTEGGDGIAFHAVATLGLSFDHRAFDGAYAAGFLARLKELLETRDWVAEL